MIILKQIDIRGFRSIRDGSIDLLADFTTFAGLNNSGKSNVLRALNAFFNGETDPGRSVNVDTDYYKPDLRGKKRKQISVSVQFSLPSNFKFRKGLDNAKNLLGASFTLTKVWKRGEQLAEYQLNGKTLDLNERQHVEQFLQLVRFRYVPNRVMPLDIIKSEHVALRDVLVRRLGKKAGKQANTFSAIRDASKSVISSMVNRLHQASPDLGEVRLATPTSWADMVFAFGYKLGSDGIELDDAFQGSGIQSLLMFETLYLIDRDYFQRFGWRQAAIWAVEEPESSLHASLEARVASYLASIASEREGRLQVLATTHSDLILQYSKKAFLVERQGFSSSFTTIESPRQAVEKLSQIGVSKWSHPLLFCPLEPLILVDGKYDTAFWREAFRLLRPSQMPQVVSLEDIQGGSGTGGRELYPYLKSNIDAIKSRPQEAKVVIVLDWDDAGRKQQFEKLLPGSNNLVVVVWPDTAFNPKLGKDFRGIERAYSDRLIEASIGEGAAISSTTNGHFVVSDKDEYGNVKKILFELVKQGITSDDLRHAREFIREVISAAGASE